MSVKETRYIQKNKAGLEDILTGAGSVEQSRNKTTVPITKINASNLPYSGDPDTSDVVSIKAKIDTEVARLDGVDEVQTTDIATLKARLDASNLITYQVADIAERDAITDQLLDEVCLVLSEGIEYYWDGSAWIFWSYNQGFDQNLNTSDSPEFADVTIESIPIINTKMIGNINSPILDMPLIHDINMRTGSGSSTFTRASTATYVDRYGVLKYAAIDEPRFEKAGLLIEGESTNLIPYSESFDNWIIQGSCSVTANAVEAPDGNITADTLTKIAAGSDARIQHFTPSGTSKVTGSLYLKAGGSNTYDNSCRVFLYDTALTGQPATGRILSGPGSISGTTIQTITGLSETEWTRIEVSLDAIPAVNTHTFYIYPSSLSTEASVIHVWGAQLEEHPYTSSYIPTETTAVTRAADIPIVDRYDNIPDQEQNFSVILDFYYAGKYQTDYPYIFRLENSSGFLMSLFGGVNTLRTIIGDSILLTPDKINIDMASKIVWTFDGTTQKQYINGIKISESQVNLPLTNKTTSAFIMLGCSDLTGSNSINGHIKNFKIYDFSLSEAEARLA